MTYASGAPLTEDAKTEFRKHARRLKNQGL